MVNKRKVLTVNENTKKVKNEHSNIKSKCNAVVSI